MPNRGTRTWNESFSTPFSRLSIALLLSLPLYLSIPFFLCVSPPLLQSGRAQKFAAFGILLGRRGAKLGGAALGKASRGRRSHGRITASRVLTRRGRRNFGAPRGLGLVPCGLGCCHRPDDGLGQARGVRLVSSRHLPFQCLLRGWIARMLRGRKRSGAVPAIGLPQWLLNISPFTGRGE